MKNRRAKPPKTAPNLIESGELNVYGSPHAVVPLSRSNLLLRPLDLILHTWRLRALESQNHLLC